MNPWEAHLLAHKHQCTDCMQLITVDKHTNFTSLTTSSLPKGIGILYMYTCACRILLFFCKMYTPQPRCVWACIHGLTYNACTCTHTHHRESQLAAEQNLVFEVSFRGCGLLVEVDLGHFPCGGGWWVTACYCF